MPTLPAVMPEAAMERQTPRGCFCAFRYQGALVCVSRITDDPVEASALYKAGIRHPGNHGKSRAITHLYYRPL